MNFNFLNSDIKINLKTLKRILEAETVNIDAKTNYLKWNKFGGLIVSVSQFKLL